MDDRDSKLKAKVQVRATLDNAGQPAGALGVHQLTIPLPAGLPPDPQKPYVLVVADPAIPGALSDPAQTAAFRTYVIGIVTHGGLQNTHWKFGPAWQAKTAAILNSQGYDAVIAYHWMSDSNHPGRAARQGPRLANEILAVASQFPSGAPVDLHFIGHSEGAVVNTQAIVSLESMMTPELKAGYIKDTLLDPHAANNAVPGQQYSLTSGPLGWLAKAEIDSFQSKAKDPAVFVPSVVNDAEVFYQHTLASQSHGVNSGIYNLWGEVPVRGPAHYYNLTAAGATHAGKTGVSEWYANFVAPTLGGQAPLVQTLQLDAQDRSRRGHDNAQRTGHSPPAGPGSAASRAGPPGRVLGNRRCRLDGSDLTSAPRQHPRRSRQPAGPRLMRRERGPLRPIRSPAAIIEPSSCPSPAPRARAGGWPSSRWFPWEGLSSLSRRARIEADPNPSAQRTMQERGSGNLSIKPFFFLSSQRFHPCKSAFIRS